MEQITELAILVYYTNNLSSSPKYVGAGVSTEQLDQNLTIQQSDNFNRYRVLGISTKWK
jgi:hypothetical protein